MKRIIFAVALFIAAVAVAGNFLTEPQSAQVQENPQIPTSARDAMFSKFISQAEASGSVRLIVGLDAGFVPVGNLNRDEASKQGRRIKSAQNEFMGRYFAQRGTSGTILFETIPFVAFTADAGLLRQMANDGLIKSIEEDVADAPSLAESTAVINAPAVWSSGYTGSGWAVAIIDSGVMKTHSFLTGKVVSEACYSQTVSPNSTTVCPGGVSQSTDVGSGVNCDPAVAGCPHGTHVAGIVAGNGATSSGVAKGANLIAIQAFSRFDNATSCGTGNPVPCVLSYVSDQVRGLERVLALSSTMNIASVNMSLGGGQNTSYCDATQAARKAAIDNLRSVNVPTIIASGNNGFTNAISAPACISTAFSVGSTGDGSSGATTDVVVSSSNSASFLDFLAPGRWINSSVAATGSTTTFENYSGTSMATPHVAGAWAVLKQRKPNASIAQIANSLRSTGLPVTDGRNGIVKPRINLANAATRLGKYGTNFDNDGDTRADLSVRRPTDNIWYLLQGTAGFTAITWGQAGDLMAPADYDGDGKSDVAVFRPSTGQWYVVNSSNLTFETFSWGQSGDLPVPTDRDNDGRSDLVLYRPSNNTWYPRSTATGPLTPTQFGEAGDKPMVGDFDADGIGDIALFRPSNNNWYIIKSSLGYFVQTWGEAGDIPTTGDFDGDGATDQAVFRPSTGQWYLSRTTAGFSSQFWGQNGDIPVAADYDGDGKTDVAVFRPSNATWYIVQSTAGILIQQFGQTGDAPTQSSYLY